MIERHGTNRTLICEDCDTVYDQVSADEFGSMIASAKNEGWQVKPDGEGGWEHRCSRCRVGSGLDRARRMFGAR